MKNCTRSKCCLLVLGLFLPIILITTAHTWYSGALYAGISKTSIYMDRPIMAAAVTPPTPSPTVKTTPPIFFLKTHKTGSSAIQNILMRVVQRNNWTMAVGDGADYSRLCMGHHYDRHCPANTEEMPYDIITHHLRLNFTEIEASLKPNPAFISILRHPNALIRSGYTYFKWTEQYNSLEKFLTRYKFLKFDPTIAIPYKNLMLYAFGLSYEDAKNTELVSRMISKIESRFDLIMIMEYFEESLILLRHLLALSIEQVAVFSVNKQSEKATGSIGKVSHEAYRNLEIENSADITLYETFLSIFKQKVQHFGVDRMEKEKTILRNTIMDFQDICSGQKNHTDKISVSDCLFLKMPELEFTMWYRHTHYLV